jgi:hypothetical protein
VTDASLTTFSFDLETLGTPTAFEDHLLNFDMPTAITPSNHLSNFIASSTYVEEQVALRHFSRPAESLKFSTTNIIPFARSRIGYAIEQLKLAPRMMVEENATLWCHATLYEEQMPRPLQDAHAACALYVSRNDVNVEFVARHISDRVKELIATHTPTDPIEILARAHALMLYQVMLVFGGDMRFYGQAEILLSHLEHVGNLLLALNGQQCDPTEKLPLHPSAAARAAWTSFVYRETLRRTVLSLFQFLALCHLLQGGQVSSCSPELAQGNRITLSAHLWGAKSALDFAVAWNEKKHLLVHDLDFSEVLSTAHPGDIDNFAKAMLVGLQGIDDVKGWFYTHGAAF